MKQTVSDYKGEAKPGSKVFFFQPRNPASERYEHTVLN